jgi:hypothetical protein
LADAPAEGNEEDNINTKIITIILKNEFAEILFKRIDSIKRANKREM